MLLTLAIVFTFISVFVLSLLALIVPTAERRQVSKSLRKLEAYEVVSHVEAESRSIQEMPVRSFAERVGQPFLNWLTNLAKKVTPIGMIEYINRQLILAGNPRELNADRFLSLKAVSSLIMLGIIVLLAILSVVSKSRLLWVGIVTVPSAFFAPDLWLKHRAEKRQSEITRALPDILDLLTISVEAGLAFDAALAKVIKNNPGALAQEFSKMLSECQVGISRKEALKNLAERTSVPELQAFVAAMVQADIFGISISKVLRTQASEMRIKRRQKAEEVAMKAPVKIVFPLVVCILPAILIVIVGPAAIRIASSLLPIISR